MAIEIKLVKFSDIVDDLMPIILFHHKELNYAPDKLNINLDTETYLKAEANDRLLVFVAKDGEKTVGYYCGFTSRMLHNADTIGHYEDTFYVIPEYRNGSVSGPMFTTVREEITRRGVKVWRTTARTAAAIRFFQRLGFKKLEESFFMLLGD